MKSPDASPTASTASFDPESHPISFGFANTYALLPERFYSRLDPTPVAAPRLVKLNVELARTLDLDPDALASVRGWPATAWPKGLSLSRKPMLDTSSAISCLNSATAAPTCWVK
jgi:hypothetical protein